MDAKRSGRDPAKERFWREAVRGQTHSGQSIREYCRERQLAESAFYFWRRELRQRDAARPASRNGGRPRTVKRMPGSNDHELFVPVSVVETNGACSAPTAGKEGDEIAIEMTLPSGTVLRWAGGNADAGAEWIARLEARLC